MQANEERLRKLMADVFEVEESVIHPASTWETVPTWDSLNTLKLIMAIEAEFKVRYPEEDMTQAINWSSVVKSLRLAGVQI